MTITDFSMFYYRAAAAAAAAVAAKSLQSCPTLCNPIDGSPLGFPDPAFLTIVADDAGAAVWGPPFENLLAKHKKAR